MSIEFTILVPPRTKKNSQRIVMGKGHPIVLPSKQYVEYEKNCKAYVPAIEPIDYPVNIKAVYFMQTRHRVDLCNLHEALCDMLVHHKVLEDDNCKIVASMDGSYVDYDKENPRTEVVITRKEQ